MSQNRANRKRFRVGVIVNNVGGYSRGVVRGVASFAFARAWTCRVQGVNEESIFTKLVEFDGLIVQAATAAQVAELHIIRVPVVNVSSALELSDLPNVVSDDHAVGRLGAEFFLRRGYRRFIFYGPDTRQFVRLRHGGFAERLSEGKASCTHVTTEDALSQILTDRGERIALMACNDRAGLGAIEICRNRGLKIPNDVSVLGVDNDELIQSLAYPPLSTINTARDRIGFEASEMLEKLLHGEKLRTRTVLIPPKGVITRQSTDTMAIKDEYVAEAVRWIAANAGRRIGVDSVMREITISRRQLERRFRSALGRSILDEILRCRVDRAKQLLMDTELTLPQVADACGFSSPSYFSVVFRDEVGAAPGAYRSTLRTTP